MLNTFYGDQVAAGSSLAKATNSVVQIGVNMSGAYWASASPIGWGGTFSTTLAFDPSGNIAIAVSYGHGPTVGEGVQAGLQLSISPRARSVMDLSGPSTSKGLGFADELAGSMDWSSNAGGTLTVTGGVGVGQFGAFRTEGPTAVVPLVCN
jgi:hypothetical protein